MDNEPKKRGRPARAKQIAIEEIITPVIVEEVIIPAEDRIIPRADLQQQIVEVIKEIIVEKEVPARQLEGFALYKALQRANFPQGGMGSYMEDPNSTDRVYVPHPSEVYGMFIGDPQQWEMLRDAICRGWLQNQHGNQ